METRSLKTSQYAIRTPAESAALSREQRIKQEKESATRLLARLRWKAESLMTSYVRAMEIRYAEAKSNGALKGAGGARYPFVLDMNSTQVESMFKVDFFEFYALLERYVTLCLSILGVTISAGAPVRRTNVNALRFITNPDFAKTRSEASHQFHANLLEALDNPDNPLHPALGSQDVRIQLGLAKDYRNRWKDADGLSTNSQRNARDDGWKSIKLDDLDLENMLRTILAGCHYALNIVQDRADSLSNRAILTNGNLPSNVYHGFDFMEMDDTPLEYMDDAMDLD